MAICIFHIGKKMGWSSFSCKLTPKNFHGVI